MAKKSKTSSNLLQAAQGLMEHLHQEGLSSQEGSGFAEDAFAQHLKRAASQANWAWCAQGGRRLC